MSLAGLLAQMQGGTRLDAALFHCIVSKGWALLASGQITMRKVDGGQSLAGKPSGQIIDLTASSDNIVTLEIAVTRAMIPLP